MEMIAVPMRDEDQLDRIERGLRAFEGGARGISRYLVAGPVFLEERVDQDLLVA